MSQLAPTPTPTALPTALPSPTPRSYFIDVVQPPSPLGIDHLYIASGDALYTREGIDPADLRLPGPEFYPQTGRFGDVRGPYRLLHLGSDYFLLHQATLTPPHESALLVAAAYVYRDSYTGIAIDMSGNVQMYLITLALPEGDRAFLFSFCHLAPGSNESAVAMARASGGQVDQMGSISTVGGGDNRLSDVHISVIEVDLLLAFTATTDLHDALVELYADRLPRSNQQYPSIFVEPESVYPALRDLLAEWSS